MLGHRYDDAGFWEYYSLRNLFWYLSGGVGGTLLAVYATDRRTRGRARQASAR